METAYDVRQVAGMDLHRCRWVLVRMTEDGRRAWHVQHRRRQTHDATRTLVTLGLSP